MKRILSAIRAAFTSPEVVKAERSTATLIFVRLLLNLGAGAGTVELARQIITG